MFDFLKPMLDSFKGAGTGDEAQTSPTKKTTPPEVKAKPKAEEKAGGDGGGFLSSLFKGLFDGLGEMGEDPTEDKDLAKSVEKNPPTKQEVEKSGPELKAVDQKSLTPPEEVVAKPEELLKPVVKDASKLGEPMLDPVAAEKTEQEKARESFDAGPKTPQQQAVLDQADTLAGKDIVGVAEARRLAALAKEAGVPAELLPKASTPEEILRAKGMTDEEIELYKGTLNKNQQSTMTPAEKDEYAKKNKKIEDSATKDATGEERKAASPEEIQAALKANIILFDQMQPGLPLTKIIPEAQVGGFLVGEMVDDKGKSRKMTKMAGDIGNSANTEGMTAEEKVGYLGLDYDEKTYVERKGDGTVEVKDKCKERLYQIEQAATEDQVKFAQVPMGHDMYQAALLEAQRLKKEGKPLPRLLELDENGQLLHVVERNRNTDKDPSAGFGYTASMILRKPEGEEGEGEQYFSPNQEMNAGAQNLSKGAELTSVNDKGERQVLARFDGKRFVPVEGLPPDEAARLQAMIDDQQKTNAANNMKNTANAD